MEPKLELIQELIGIVEESGLAELTVESGEHTITIRTTSVALASPTIPHGVVIEAEPAPPREPAETAPTVPLANESAVVSPMIGVYYRSPAPESPAFVEIGSTVEVGQTIGIVEAMKVFNEIPSDVRGKVIALPAKNQALVQIGEPLVVVERL